MILGFIRITKINTAIIITIQIIKSSFFDCFTDEFVVLCEITFTNKQFISELVSVLSLFVFNKVVTNSTSTIKFHFT